MKKKFFKTDAAQIDMFGAAPVPQEKPQEIKQKSSPEKPGKEVLTKVLQDLKEIEKLIS